MVKAKPVSEHKIEQLHLTEMKLKDVNFDPDNPNRLTDVEEKSLTNSMERFGYDEFAIVQRHELNDKGKIVKKFKNLVANGEHRIKKLIEDGHEKGFVVYRDMTEVERRLLRQVHNKLGGQHDPVLDKKEIELLKKLDLLGDLSDLIAISTKDLEFQIREGTRFSTRDQDANPLDASAQMYLEGNIKQIVLFFDNKAYTEIMPKVEKLQQELGIDNHTDLFVRIFNEWLDKHESNTS